MAKNAEKVKPVVIKIKPGTAAERSMSFTLPEEMYAKGPTVEEIVEYGLGLTEAEGITRESLRIKDRIKTEMGRGKYGLAVNNLAVDGNVKITDQNYLVPKVSPGKKEYLEAVIIIASRQEGASGVEYRI